MRMLQLEKQRLKTNDTEKKLIEKLGERTENLISEWNNWQNEKSNTLKQYNYLYNNQKKLIESQINVLNRTIEKLNTMNDLNKNNKLGKNITLGENAFEDEEKATKDKINKLKDLLNSLKGKSFDKNKIKEKEEKEDEKAIEDKKQARTYDSIKKFNDAIDNAQKKHKKIKSILVNKISAIENEISSPEIIFDNQKNVYKIRKKEEEKSINEILTEELVKEKSEVVLDKYENAFNEELNDLDDYVIVPNTYKDRFYKIDGDIKKALKKNNTGSYYGLNKESYDNDVNEINKLISMLQDEINRETKKRDPEKDKTTKLFCYF